MSAAPATDPSPNRGRLEAFLESAMRRAAALPPATAAGHLRANAEVMRRHLQALSAWAASEAAGPCPPHLKGLTAFDLADAADALETEAARRRA